METQEGAVGDQGETVASRAQIAMIEATPSEPKRMWYLGNAAVDPLPPIGLADPTEYAISFGGHYVFHAPRPRSNPDGSGSTYPLGPPTVQRVHVKTGSVAEAPIPVRAERLPNILYLGPSPDGQRVVVAERWFDPEPGPVPDLWGLPGPEQTRLMEELSRLIESSTRLTLSVLTFDGMPASHAATLHAETFGGQDCAPVQWSPDGRWVAVGILDRETWDPFGSVGVFDASTWEMVRLFVGVSLAGTASWGPASDRILVQSTPEETSVQHLDGEREPIETLPPTDDSQYRPIRPLGLIDNHHLLTLRVRSRRATLMRTSIATGKHEKIFSWACGPYAYPLVAPMPPSAWAPGQ